MAAKILCNDLNIPVLIVSSYFQGLLEFIQMIDYECIILVDEAEKLFYDREASHCLLRMIDGVYNASKKLYLLTTNRLDIDENLIGRPGRIRYIKQFGNISLKAINDYIDDNLKYPEFKDYLTKTASEMNVSTIDTLRCIVDEVNMTGTTDNFEYLNVDFKKKIYNILRSDIDAGTIQKFNEGIKYLDSLGFKTDQELLEWLDTPLEREGSELSRRVRKNKNKFAKDYAIYTTVAMILPPVLKSGYFISEEYGFIENVREDGWILCRNQSGDSKAVKFLSEVLNSAEDGFEERCVKGTLGC